MLGRLISARATAEAHKPRRPHCRGRRAKRLRTTTGAAAPVAAFAFRTSVVAALAPYLAAEYPIGPGGVTEDQRYQHGNPEQQEDEAVLRCRRLPDGDALRHDIGMHADAEPRIGQREQC